MNTARYRAIMRSAMLKQQLRGAGVPDVRQVWAHEIGASRMLIALAIQTAVSRSRQAGWHIGGKLRRQRLRLQDGDRGRR